MRSIGRRRAILFKRRQLFPEHPYFLLVPSDLLLVIVQLGHIHLMLGIGARVALKPELDLFTN